MSRLSGWFLRIRRAINPKAFETEMAEEMRLHLEMVAATRRVAGQDDAAAQRGAALEFGHVDSYKEQIRDRRFGRGLEQVWQDLRYAIRLVRRAPAFSAAVIVTIGLGIGINTAVFTAAQSVLVKAVPVPNGERLVTVSDVNVVRTNRPAVSWPDYLEYRAGNDTFDGLEAGAYGQATLSEANVPPEQFRMMWVTPGLFDLVHTPPVLGRPFAPADGRPGAARVVLIGHHVWKNRYGGAADVIGRAVRLNGAPATIVGVMPVDFRFPTNEDLWVPLAPTPEMEQRSHRELILFGLLKPGVTMARADQNLAKITGRLAAEFPGETGDVPVVARTFRQTFVGEPAKAGAALMLGAVGFVLLIACANVSNLMLSRGFARSREISVRAALGASRWRIVRQLLAESVLLSSLGGVLGFGIAVLGVRGLGLATDNVGMPYWIRFDVDYTVLLYLMAISVVSGTVFGLVPALRACRADLNTTLKNGAPTVGTRRDGRLTGALTVLQFALTVVLLAGAGMLWRSFVALKDYNHLVPADRILVASLRLPERVGETYADPSARRRFVDQLLPRLLALPGVTHVAAASHLPGLGGGRSRIEIEGQPVSAPEKAPRSSVIVQTPGYLAAVGLPLRSGRPFQESDGRPGQEGAVVTRTFASRHWPAEAAVGKRFRFINESGPGPWIEVIGESVDFIENPSSLAPIPVVFISNEQTPMAQMTLLLRTASEPTGLATSLRAAVQSVDPEVPLFQVQTLAAALEGPRWGVRFFGALFFVFSLAGLVTAAVGIYAVVAYSTGQRTREIGIRMALGATAGRILRLVLSQGLRQLVIGVTLGLVGGAILTQVMRQTGLLMRVPPHDPIVFAAITALVVGVGIIACLVPACRATRVAPTEALRVE